MWCVVVGAVLIICVVGIAHRICETERKTAEDIQKVLDIYEAARKEREGE